MDPISIALGIAQFVPGIARWLGGDKAGDVADKVIGVAKQVTGIANPQQSLEKLRTQAELQVKLQQAMNPVIVAQYEAEARELESINATIRAESRSKDAFVRRWRPYFGYVLATTWGMQMTALSILIVQNPTAAPAVIGAMAGLSAMWGIALAVLGVSIHKRSQDKQVCAGQTPAPGMLQAVASKLMGGAQRG